MRAGMVEMPCRSYWASRATSAGRSTTAGAGVDDPDNGDLSVGGLERNATYFTNAIYNINKQTRVGVEASYQETDWKGIADGHNIRVQSSLQFNF